jgi:hypothetical protein
MYSESGSPAGADKATTTKMKAQGDTATTEMRAVPSIWSRILRVAALVALTGLIIAAGLGMAAVAAWATATGHGAVVAGTVIALGAALAATAFFTEAARRSAPWLLAVALLLAAPAGAVAAADIRFDGAVGEREYTPTSLADVREDGYELGVGQLIVDLRQIELAEGQTLEVATDLGVGQTIVSVPQGVCVVGEADAKAGELLVRGDSNSGVEPEFDRGDPESKTAPRVVIDSHLEVGQLVVTDDDPSEYEDEGPKNHHGPGGGDDVEEAAANAEACAA